VGKRLVEPAAVLYPLPVVLVSCGRMEGPRNIVTVAWTGVACSDPPMITIALRPDRYSCELIRRYGDFVVNVPHREQLQAVDWCGTVSGRDVDKFAAMGLTARAAARTAAPLIEECPVNLECEVRHQLRLGSHWLFVGEVLAVQVDDGLGEDSSRWPLQVPPLVYCRGRYHGLGELLAEHGFSRKEQLG